MADPASAPTLRRDMTSGAAGSPEGASGSGIGVYGGSFNPPHTSHVRLCRQAVRQLPIERLLVVPSGDHPHKRGRTDMAPARHRLAMARLAFAGLPGVTVDDRELNRQGPSFTVDTLAEIAAEHPGRRLFFLIGSDNLPLLPTWHEHHRLLALATVVTCPRLGHPVCAEALAELDLTDDERRMLLDNVLAGPADDVSSTGLREGDGDDAHELPAVRDYIEEHGLYR